MRHLNLKLFLTSVVSAVGLIAFTIFLGKKAMIPIPTWGIIVLLVLGTITTVSALLLLIRKMTGAEQWNDSL